MNRIPVVVMLGQSNLCHTPIPSILENNSYHNVKIYQKCCRRESDDHPISIQEYCDNGEYWTLSATHDKQKKLTCMSPNNRMGPELYLAELFNCYFGDTNSFVILKLAVGGTVIGKTTGLIKNVFDNKINHTFWGWDILEPNSNQLTPSGVFNFFENFMFQPAITKLKNDGFEPDIKFTFFASGESDARTIIHHYQFEKCLHVFKLRLDALFGQNLPFILKTIPVKYVRFKQTQAKMIFLSLKHFVNSSQNTELIDVSNFPYLSLDFHFDEEGQLFIAVRLFYSGFLKNTVINWKKSVRLLEILKVIKFQSKVLI